jgi:hypothetical protein
LLVWYVKKMEVEVKRTWPDGEVVDFCYGFEVSCIVIHGLGASVIATPALREG